MAAARKSLSAWYFLGRAPAAASWFALRSATAISAATRCESNRCCKRSACCMNSPRAKTAIRRAGPSADLAAVDLVGARFKGGREAAKRYVEHRTHQHRQHAASKFVVDIKLDLAGLQAQRPEVPAIFHMAERATEILDQDLEIGAVERNAAGEGLPHELVSDGHIRRQHLDTLAFRVAAFHSQRPAQRNELRIFLDIGDKVKHLRGVMAHAPLRREGRHELRAAPRRFEPGKVVAGMM